MGRGGGGSSHVMLMVFTVKHLPSSPLTVCQPAGEARGGFIGSRGSADDGRTPLVSVGPVNGEGRDTLLKGCLFLLHVP